MRAILSALLLLTSWCVTAAAGAAEDNILRNAGFTQCANAGIPDYWGSGAPEYVNNWPGNYHTTPDSPIKGTQSLMLRNIEGQSNWTVQSYLYRGMQPDADYTLSVYLRGDNNGMPVVLGMGATSKTVNVSTDWERYTWTAKPGAASWGYTIRFSVPKGTLWIAAPMWTRGGEAAPFALNPSDTPKETKPGAPTPPAKPVPSVTVPLLPNGEPHDGAGLSDALWSKAVTLPAFVDYQNDMPAKTQTRVRLAATDDALHIFFDCSQPDMEHVQIVGDKYDSNVFSGECVEFFIAPERTLGSYYHFALNPNGVKADEENFDPSWSTVWTAQTKKYADHWTADITVPWWALPTGAKAGTVWGMNFCRHAKATTEELSEWSFTDGSFHNPPRFGLVTLPAGIVNPRAMDVAWTGTWTEGDKWGLTLSITPGQHQTGAHSVGAEVQSPGTTALPPPVSLAAKSVAFVPGKPVPVKLGSIQGNPVPGEYTAVVSVCEGNARRCQVRTLTRAVLQPTAVADTGAPLTALFDRSYYTTESQARLRVWCSDPRAVEARVSVSGNAYTGKLAPGARSRWTEIAVPLAGLPLGKTSVMVSVADKTEAALDLKWQDDLVKLEDKPYGAKIDRFAACFIVDGKPFIPYCMGIHNISQIDRLQDIKDHGFNSICAIFGGSVTEQDLQANLPAFNRFFDTCRKLGLKVIWWNGGGQDYEKIRDGLVRNIKAFQDNDLIIAWYILDEPEGWWESPTRKESDLPKFHEAVTEADPYRPSFFNYYSWKKGYGGYGGLVSSDLGSLDRYPIGRGDAMKAMDDITREMAADCLPVGKPVSIWLQLYGYDDAIREATPAEQRCQTYLCLIEGARSVLYFIYKPMSVAMWESMRPLGQEIETLTPVFAAPPTEKQVTVDTDLIRFMVRLVNGKWYIICANRSTSTVKATFDVAALGGPAGLGVKGAAQDLFGKRTIAINGGKLVDEFAPLATRTYVIGPRG
jgi:hypothetical protein